MSFWSRLIGFFRSKPEVTQTTEKRTEESLVLLLGRPRGFSEQFLVDLLCHQFGLGEEGLGSEEFVTGSPPTYFIRFRKRMFMLNTWATPYYENPQRVASGIGELRVKK